MWYANYVSVKLLLILEERKEGRKQERKESRKEGGSEEGREEGRREGRREERKEGRNWTYFLEQKKKEKCGPRAFQYFLSGGSMPLFRASSLPLPIHLVFCIRVCWTIAFTQLLHGPRSAFLRSVTKLGSHRKLAKFLQFSTRHSPLLKSDREAKLSVGRLKDTWLHPPIFAYTDQDQKLGQVLGMGEG